MAKERIFNLPETKGEFKARGLTSGTTKDKFYKEKKTKSGKNKRELKFGLKVNDEGGTVYINLEPTEKEYVYFYKNGDKKKGIKGESKKIPFAKRDEFKEEGFNPIGIRVGIEQYIDEKGAVKNKTKNMFEFDTTEYLKKTLKEEEGLFVRGNLEYSSFVDGSTGNIIRMNKCVPTQISGLTASLDFKGEKFESCNDFIQTIIFINAEMDNSDPNDKKGIVEAKVVTYSSIEDVEFIVRNPKIFQTLKKNLKPYNAIKIFGKINNILEVEEVEDDGWGTENNSFEQTGTSFTREMLILGADPSTIDKETYTQALVDEALELIKKNQEAYKNFGENTTNNETVNDEWSSVGNDENSEEVENGWE